MGKKEVFRSWLVIRRKILVTPIIILLILVALLWVYSMPRDAILYTILLYIVLTLASFSLDFSSYYKDTKALSALNKTPPITLPSSKSIKDNYYGEIIRELEQTISSEKETHRQDMVSSNDYYTLWTHQIKTPISALKLLTEEKNIDASSIKSELFKIEQYVSMALGYQRLNSIEEDFEFSEYNLDDLVKQAVKNYAPIFIHQNTPIKIEPISKTIVTDRKWFVFVIEQILSNSLKYSADKPIKIYHENDYLIIEDGGIGIKKEHLPLLFQKGFTGEAGRIYEGSTGLGLYLSHKILTRLFLDIKVESEQNNGTKVYISTKQFTPAESTE